MNYKARRAFLLICLNFLSCNIFSAVDCNAQQGRRTAELILDIRSNDQELAHFAAIELRRKGEEGVIELVRLIDDPQAFVRYFAAYGLCNGEVDSRSMQAILQRLDHEKHTAVVCALLQALEEVATDIEKPASIVSRYLKSDNGDVRTQATRTLTKFKTTDPAIKEMLFSLLSDQDPDCRLAASHAVAQMALSRDDIDKMESRIFSEDSNAQYHILYAIIDNKPLAAYFIDKFPKSVASFEYIPSLITGLLSDTDDDLQGFRTRLKDNPYLPSEVMVRLGELRYAKILRARVKRRQDTLVNTIWLVPGSSITRNLQPTF
ncbi:MAG: HEAT repeat domain-containing protein [Pirellulales bacterium]